MGDARYQIFVLGYLMFQEIRYDVVYVEIGSNDLCQSDDPRWRAKHLVAFADYLCESQGIKPLCLGQCLRKFPSRLTQNVV